MIMPLDTRGFKAPEPDLATVLKGVLAGVGQTLDEAETLPREAYTSQAFFDLEVEKIFRRDWLCVGHVSQIPNVGDYFSVDVLSELLVVVRGADRVRVMSRICLHRWAPVVEGRGNTKVLSCPFHKWGYGLDGQLLGAPLMEEARGFEPKNCRLPEVRSEIVGGVIYITFDNDAYSIREKLADFSTHMARYEMDDLVVGWQVDYVCNFNWKIAVETFMECYHHIGAHRETVEPLHPGRMTYIDDSRPGWTICWEPLRPDAKTDEVLSNGLPPFPNLSDEELRLDSLALIYPMTLYGITPNRISVTGLIPVGPQKTLWRRNVLVPRATFEMPDFQEKVAKARVMGDRIAQEDLDVNDMQQIGATSFLAQPGRLSHLEKVVWQLADFVRDRVGR
jgi:phenylpropionate dioxygenase-like ring-hydroxylating dioxygenase large terminal subunit